MTPEEIQNEFSQIQERNRRVEADKAWETSFFRRGLITLATYLVALAWLAAIDESLYPLKALVPALGYVLSTLSLPAIQRWWTDKQKFSK